MHETPLKGEDWVFFYFSWEHTTYLCWICVNCSRLHVFSPVSECLSILSVTFLKGIHSGSAVLVQRRFRTTTTMFVSSAFQILWVACVWYPFLIWPCSRCFTKSTKIDKDNSYLNSICWSIQFTISTGMKQPQQVLDSKPFCSIVYFSPRLIQMHPEISMFYVSNNQC
jgi:hypothetical protein